MHGAYAAADVAAPSTVLLTAAEDGDFATVDALLAGGEAGLVNFTTSTGITALMKAAHCGQAAVVECLLNWRADATMYDGTHEECATAPGW